MTAPERLSADTVCPNRPGRGHELYRRSHDGTMFCRDCGWGWHDRGWFCEEECDHAAGVYMCEQSDGLEVGVDPTPVYVSDEFFETLANTTAVEDVAHNDGGDHVEG